MTRGVWFFLAAILQFQTYVVRAEEGFFSEPNLLPRALYSVWDGTVVVASSTQSNAGFFVGPSLRHPKRSYFLMCAHSVEAAQCLVGATCSDYHVVHDGRFFQKEGRASGSGREYWDRAFTVIAVDQVKDLALVEVDANPRRLTKPVFTKKYKYGETVYAIGAPLVSMRGEWHINRPSSLFIQKYWSMGKAFGISLLFQQPTYDVMQLAHTADTLPGSSGGPVVDENGRVLGINSRVSKANVARYSLGPKQEVGDWASAVSAADVIDFLSQNGVPTSQQ